LGGSSEPVSLAQSIYVNRVTIYNLGKMQGTNSATHFWYQTEQKEITRSSVKHAGLRIWYSSESNPKIYVNLYQIYAEDAFEVQYSVTKIQAIKAESRGMKL
jgi:hypothetical protein